MNKYPQKVIVYGVIIVMTIITAVYAGYFESEDLSFIIKSSSMSPIMKINDTIIVDPTIPFDSIEIGDIIVFDRPSDRDRVIVHRVVSIIDDDPLTLRTQGDANPASIPGTDFPITEEEYIGKVSRIIEG